MTSGFRIEFPEQREGYLEELSKGRWRREFLEPCRGENGILEVLDLTSLPAPGSGSALAAAARARRDAAIFPFDSAAAERTLRWLPPSVSTLREFEELCGPAPEGFSELDSPPENPPARFRPQETSPTRLVAAAGFRVLRVAEKFGVREEILALIPKGARELLDVGCGAAETAGEARRRIPGLRATGIDSHPDRAAAARENLDLFLLADAREAIAELSGRKARFDTLVFADFLEHTIDPHAILKASLALASHGASVVVSVPNAACIPVIEDLLLGRFDPIGAGVEDSSHLRWFTRRLLIELLESVGLTDIRVRAVPVPSPGDDFLARLRNSGIAHREEELCAIQWIATGTVQAP